MNAFDSFGYLWSESYHQYRKMLSQGGIPPKEYGEILAKKRRKKNKRRKSK